jgi:TonB-dependent starch-binding outer membrane protein SusC
MLLMNRLLIAFLSVACLFSAATGFSQSTMVTGKVSGFNFGPLEGATISLKGKKVSVLTNNQGEFKIVAGSSDTLLASYIDYERREIPVGSKTRFSIVLQPGRINLDSVVVIGYGVQKKKDVTGAISSVSGNTIKDLPVQTVADAIQGRVAGVEVVQESGEPGTSPQITIRGVSSLNQPTPLYIVDGIRGSGDNINPKDIQSIDILKDASAASIYGAAAAGGVIIVTTKKGIGAKPVINFSARYGETTPNVLKLLNTPNFVALKKLVLDPNYYNNNMTDTFPNTDWVNAVFRNGSQQNYDISVSGSTPVVNYFLSGIYNNQAGVYLDNNSDFYAARANVDVKLGNRVKIGEQIYVWNRNTRPVDYSGQLGGAENPRLNPPFRTVPTMKIQNPDGSWGSNPPGFSGPNIVGQIESKNRSAITSNFQGNIYGDLNLPLSLTFRVALGYTDNEEQNNDFQGILRTSIDAVLQKSLSKSFVSYTNLQNTYTLSFNHTYNNLHTFNAVIGYEQYKGLYNALYTSETNVGGNSYAPIATSATVTTIANGGYDPYPLVKSVFGRLNYNFEGKYFMSVSARQDADYTHFGPTHQKGVFPAASVGWQINQEDFFKKMFPNITLLKLRASYGSLGNSNIPTYLFYSGYTVINAQNYAPGGLATTNYTEASIPNQDIHWETTDETNIGIDGDFKNGKIFFSVDWYQKLTYDMLYNLPVPLSSGFGNIYTNIGNVRNRGVDILLGFRDRFKQLNYSVSITGSFNNNLVTNLDGTNTNPIYDGNNNYGDRYATQGAMLNQNITYTLAGLPFGQFYGYKSLGIYKTDADAAKGPQQPGKVAHAGDLIYQDVNKDGIINDLDRTVIGNPYPKFTFGLNINLNYQHFDLSMLFTGALGVDLFNGVAPYSESIWSDGNTTSKVFNASFLGTNGLTSQPRIGVLNSAGTSYAPDPNGNYTNVSSYFVENGDYAKLKNLQVGYTFSTKLLDRAGVKYARLFVMGTNLFTITKYSGIDPELGSQDLTTNGGTTSRGIDGPYKYPSVKIYTIGLDLSF